MDAWGGHVVGSQTYGRVGVAMLSVADRIGWVRGWARPGGGVRRIAWVAVVSGMPSPISGADAGTPDQVPGRLCVSRGAR